jgi:proline iminopeptidase
MEPLGVHDGLAVYRAGDGPPVLFMPGPHRFERPGLPNADALIAGLRALNRRVITFDPPGSGRSPRRAHLGLCEMLDCADEALRYAGVTTRVDVVGHSMGGLVAIAYAVERPAQVAGLVLVGTGSGGRAYMNAPGALWKKTHPSYAAMGRLGLLQLLWRTRAPERMLRNLIERESFFDPRVATRRQIGLLDWFRPREGRTDWHWQARKLDYSHLLSTIKVPALVLCGRHDPQFPPACSLELIEHIPSSRLVMFERSGHYPYVEEPDRFWPAVAAFFALRVVPAPS